MGRYGPGPGAYKLPPLTGYDNHDVSRHRSPQYSMGLKLDAKRRRAGPGPEYDVGGMTRFGKASPPAYSLAHRLTARAGFRTPGPGTYSPEKCPRMKDQRPAAYSMAMRLPLYRRFNTPGPNQYALPSALGPKIPDKTAAPAYSMSTKSPATGKSRSPGPAQYTTTSPGVYKSRPPEYTMGARLDMGGRQRSPGPAAYMPGPPKVVPGGYTISPRTNQMPYITANDNMPCA